MAHLDGAQVRVNKHDLAKERPSRELLSRLIADYGLARVMNTRSPSWKQRGLNIDDLSPSAGIELMLEDANLIKRPLLLDGDRAVFGFDVPAYDEITGR